ncbi:MAG: MFS transporter [Pseudonocardia sediminis]
MTTEHDVRPSTTGSRAPARAWLTLLAVALGIMVVQIDATVVTVANPVIAADLGAGPEGIQWVTTAYLLVLAGLLIPAGTVADRVGLKRAFLVAIAGFSVASLLCGLAGSVEWLIAARVLQAVFAALLGPSGLGLIRAAFPESALPRAIGVFGAVTALALAGGPMLGGVLVEYAGWPWVFFVNLPFGVVGVVVAALVVRGSAARGRDPIDVPGAVSLTAAMVSVVWAVSGAQTHGWVSVHTAAFGLAGLALLGAFVAIERRSPHPMVPLGLFRNRSFTVGCVLNVLTMVAFFAVLYYLTFYLQGVRDTSAVMTGVALLPLTAVFTVASPLAGWVTGRLGTRVTVVTGAVLTAASLALLLRLSVDSGTVTLAVPLVLAGFGAGLMLVPAIGAIVGNAPVERAGVASGIQQSMQQLGSTLGVAVFGSLLGSTVASSFPGALRAAFGGGTVAERLGGDPALLSTIPLGFDAAAQQGLTDRLAGAGTAPEEVRRVVAGVTEVAHRTFLDGVHTVYAVGIGLAVVAGLLALLVRDAPPAE